MQKKEYLRPELSLVRFTLRDVICSSPENLSTHTSGDPGWGDDPIYDDDDGLFQ